MSMKNHGQRSIQNAHIYYEIEKCHLTIDEKTHEVLNSKSIFFKYLATQLFTE